MAEQADPVAAKSGFLRMYMSNHPDTLVLYAKWYGKVTGNIISAEMTAINSQVSRSLKYQPNKCWPRNRVEDDADV